MEFQISIPLKNYWKHLKALLWSVFEIHLKLETLLCKLCMSLQAKGKSWRLKGNLISPIKWCRCWGNHTGAAPTLLIHFPAFSFSFLIPGTPIFSFVVFREVSRGNKHHYSSAWDRFKVTGLTFGKFHLSSLAHWLQKEGSGRGIASQFSLFSF